MSVAEARAWVATLQDGMCGLNDGSEPGDWRLPTFSEVNGDNLIDFDHALFAEGFKTKNFILTSGDYGAIAMWGGNSHGSRGSFGGMDSYRFSEDNIKRNPLFVWPVRDNE